MFLEKASSEGKLMLYVVISVEIGFIIQLFLQRVSSEGKTVTGVESPGADQRPSVLVGLVTRPAVSSFSLFWDSNANTFIILLASIFFF